MFRHWEWQAILPVFLQHVVGPRACSCLVSFCRRQGRSHTCPSVYNESFELWNFSSNCKTVLFTTTLSVNFRALRLEFQQLFNSFIKFTFAGFASSRITQIKCLFFEHNISSSITVLIVLKNIMCNKNMKRNNKFTGKKKSVWENFVACTDKGN